MTKFALLALTTVFIGASSLAATAQVPAPHTAAPIRPNDLPEHLRPTAKVEKNYVPPRTAWGDPQIAGAYTNSDESGIPFERPAEFAGRRLQDISRQELADIIKKRQEQTVERAPTLSAFPGATSPLHWFEFYQAANSRAWLVSDPPDGQIPALTPEATARVAARAQARAAHGPADSWEDRSLWDRCITRGLPGSMLPTLYGNSYEIHQGPGYVAIRYEMVNETRIVPLDNRPHVSGKIREYLGDARGHWDGDTLVVETTNFTDKTAYRDSSEHLTMTERFRPVGPNTLEWSVTFDDPHTWVRPWTFGMNLTRVPDNQGPFEYACNEGNYGLRDILLAARADDAAAAKESGRVIGMVHFIHATETLETTVAFYRDVFGFEAPIRPFTNPAVATLNNVPGIKLRASRPVFPDKSAWEITEFTNVARKGGQARPSDPGAIALMIPVRDIDVVYAAAKKAGAPILSRSGMPEKIQTPHGPQRALVMRDPDGYLAWAIEVPVSEATSPGLVQPGVSMVAAVKDLDATARFYRELGFDLTGSTTFTHDTALTDLLGLPANSEFRALSAAIPGTTASRVSFYEWKGMPRTPFHLNVYDPGAGGFVLRVTNLDAIVANAKAQGMRVVSEGGAPVQFGPTSRNVFIVELNGMNLELTESSAPAAPTR
ncbi:MAG TPA: VOC family protein [Vicinamibacterales bacterium]|nr:VOC family protein [Vicinamibacterales bacterium]